MITLVTQRKEKHHIFWWRTILLSHRKSNVSCLSLGTLKTSPGLIIRFDVRGAQNERWSDSEQYRGWFTMLTPLCIKWLYSVLGRCTVWCGKKLQVDWRKPKETCQREGKEGRERKRGYLWGFFPSPAFLWFEFKSHCFHSAVLCELRFLGKLDLIW